MSWRAFLPSASVSHTCAAACGSSSFPEKSNRWKASVLPSGEWSENSLNVMNPKSVSWRRRDPSGSTLNRSTPNCASPVS